MKSIVSRVRNWAPSVVLIVALLTVWQVIVTVGSVSEYLLPAPSTVADAMWSDRDIFLSEMVPTLIAIFGGFGLAIVVAIPIAIAMVYSGIVRRAVYPLLVIAQVTPLIAIAPLFIIWFGFGQAPKVLMVLLICFFPLVIDSLVGFSAARPESLMLVRSMGASRWQAFWKIRFPWALPSIFAGAKIAITLAVVGAVVAEFVGADAGLGVLIVQARGNLDSVTVFAGIAYLTLIGLVLFSIITLLERQLVRHGRAARKFEGAGSL